MGIAVQPARKLTRSEVDEADFDSSEIDEFPIFRLEAPGAELVFEESPSAISILNAHTEPCFRRQGLATLLLLALRERLGARVLRPGAFTEDGDAFLRSKIEQIFGTAIAWD